MQNHIIDMLLTDLRLLIGDLGTDGGLIGPSIYDTAQVIRLAPPATGACQTLNWLVEQQQPDGGWGDPTIPRARDVPTLAAILALHTYATTPQERQVVRAGLTFLRQHMRIWEGPLPDDLPVGIELLLPRLLEDAAAAGLSVPKEPYAALIALERRRRRMLATMPVRAGAPPAHVWEAWGVEPDPNLIDESGGVGHSPAATAAWLRASSGRADLAEARTAAHRYLRDAAAATSVGIPGVVPTVWPISRFEQSNALYALLVGGLLDHPGLCDIVDQHVQDLTQALRSCGLGMSDFFIPDGDDTAEALAVLQATGHPIDLATMQRFAHNDHFCAYHGELQPAISVTAHAAHLLHVCGQPSDAAQQYLVDRQLPDGRWSGDKWSGSWLYTTCQAVVALAGTGHYSTLERARHALVAYQHADGGWGAHGSNAEETAYGILALRTFLHTNLGDPTIHRSLEHAGRWMLRDYRPFNAPLRPCWLGKELYRPLRLARIIELAATFPSSEITVPLRMAQSVGEAWSLQYTE
jgi:hypothetical protein